MLKVFFPQKSYIFQVFHGFWNRKLGTATANNQSENYWNVALHHSNFSEPKSNENWIVEYLTDHNSKQALFIYASEWISIDFKTYRGFFEFLAFNMIFDWLH